MIKSVHKLYVAANEVDYLALVTLFDELGLTRGEGWEGKRSRGVKLEGPVAGVEIGMGQGFPPADVVIEADSADAVYAAARKRGLEIADDIASTDWGARMFTLTLPGGAGRVAVFSYEQKWRQREPGEGGLSARGRRFAVVVARFNAFVTERLLAGALDALRRSGARKQDVEVVRVPGSFELPVTARRLAETRRFDAVICLGCLLRGETLHYETIAHEVTRGLGQSAQETGVPHALGVLTCDTLEQAIDRAGLKSGNKGFEAGLSAIEMANLLSKTAKPAPRRPRAEKPPVTRSRRPRSSAKRRKPPRRF